MNYTLITGASSGIGEEFARQYAERGNSLILIARSEDKLQELAEELMSKHKGVKVKVMPIDLAQIDAAEKVYAQCKKENLTVNVLINNAGVGLIGKFDDFEIEKIENMLILNVVTLTKLAYLFLPDLKKTHGTLINLASQVAFTANPYMSSYAATKAYVLSFTEGIRVEYEKEGVRILPVCPGPTYTKFFEKAQASPKDINFKFRPPKDVVEETLAGLDKNKDVVLVGWENKVMTTLMRLLPRSWRAKFSSHMVDDKKKKEKDKKSTHKRSARMPVNKKENLKNAPKEQRDSAIVPTKDEAHKSKPRQGTQKTVVKQQVNALSTAGKKKKPK